MLPEKSRKYFLVFASYVFYASWKWQFCFLLLGLSLFNWAFGRWVLASAKTMRPLVVGILINLAALVYFKYTNFLIANAAAVADLLGVSWRPSPADIILPLGISFFTFQGIAYLFDVAAGDEPFESLTDFLLFKSFWPQLIAGPIVRLHEMRPQIEAMRAVDYSDVSEGGRRILQGAFKKMVLADNIAPYVEMVFVQGAAPNAIDAFTATLGFALQIYFDFSAYSDIAIGTARLFGFRFPENFNWPYAAFSPQDFWNRWHMTLSRWIRDYLFTPMTFASRRRPQLAPLWLLLAMAICGLWHGAQWTFVLWGVWHGVLLAANHTFARSFFAEPQRNQVVRRIVQTAVTVVLVCAGWILFRATSVEQAASMFTTILTLKGGLHAAVLRENAILIIGLIAIALFVLQSARQPFARLFESSMAAQTLVRWSRPIGYAAMLAAVIIFDQEAKAFVYFQF
ncbi:MAG TPA: MBOAT family O-acyltransferase [Gemmatimonadaceae bacterium]|nr:MBOAT family O-acyltransferase [Gemmatimonadaceae bacterium]